MTARDKTGGRAPATLYAIICDDGSIAMTDPRAARLIRHLHSIGHHEEERARIVNGFRLAAYTLVEEVPA